MSFVRNVQAMTITTDKKGRNSNSDIAKRPTRGSKPKMKFIEVLDTTLRDGEQAEGVSLGSAEKLTIANRLLKDVKVDRIEVASARTSKGERVAVEGIVRWGRDRRVN